MSSSASDPRPTEDEQSALFATLVMQLSNMGLMLLGKMETPDGTEPPWDPDAARLLIDQLVMLEEKTKGNLTREEADLLKRSLTVLRLSFVEAVDKGKGPPAAFRIVLCRSLKKPPRRECRRGGGGDPKRVSEVFFGSGLLFSVRGYRGMTRRKRSCSS